MSRTKLSKQEANELIARYPKLATGYIDYLSTYGWGESLNGKMAYRQPLSVAEIYGSSAAPAQLLVLGDDLAGYCLAYDPTKEEYGELDSSGRWAPWQHTFCIVSYFIR